MVARVFKFTEFGENLICIYRNFSTSTKMCKFLIAARISFEVLLICLHNVIWIYYYPHNINNTLYIHLTSVNSILIMFLAVYHSKRFKKLKCHLNFGKENISEERYQRNVRTKQSAFLCLVCLIGLGKLSIFIHNQRYPKIIPSIRLFWHYLLEINVLMCDLRYMFEYLALYLVLAVMSEQIQFMTHFLDGDKDELNMDLDIQRYNYMNSIKDKLTVPKIHKWYMAYEHIKECCKLFNFIFGLQLTVMLATAIFFYIIALYTAASQGVAGLLTVLDISVHCATLLLLLSILFMLSRSAQRMQNSAEILRRRVCKLLIFSVSNGETYKTIRDMLRLISTRPIRPRAFGSINVDMTLIPTCISFFTTYTVIALQFNNVL